MKRLLGIILLVTSGIFVANAYSRTITVGHDARYNYQTITEAVRVAHPGDVILVADGTYSESSGEIFPIDLGSSITLKCADSSSLPMIIQGEGKQNKLRLDGVNIRIEGLKLLREYGGYQYDRHVYIADGSSVEISNCLIARNPAGGVFCGPNSMVSFSDCIIHDNGGSGSTASRGGGVLGSMAGGGSHMTFRNCLISYNQAYYWGTFALAEGGGVHVGSGTASFINCIFAKNRVHSIGVLAMGDRASYAWAKGGGVCNGGTFINCSFIDNTVDAMYMGQGWEQGDCLGGALYGEGDLINCIVDTSMYGDITARYSDIIGGWQGEGNIDVNVTVVDPQNGSYHLLDSSPCIDAGDPDPQWNDACLPPGKGTERNDIGAYGGPHNCGWREAMWPLYRFDFGYWGASWHFVGEIAPFDWPKVSYKPGELGISPEGSANCFSYLFSSELVVENEKLYHARWKVSSSVNIADNALDFRLRANELGNWRYWTTGVVSLNDAAPTTQTKTYDLIILPEMESATDRIVLSVDLMSFDPANDLQSWLYLNQVCLDEVSITPVVPAVIPAHYSFENYTEGWGFQGKIGDFNEPVPVVLPGRIGLSPNGSAYCFSYWVSPEIQVGKDRAYLVRWLVSSSTTDPERVVDFRLRCNQTGNLRCWDTGTFFSLGHAYPTEGEPRSYDLIILPQMSTPSDTIRLSFDIMSLDASNDLNSYIFLEEVTVQEYLIR
jgi:hypothetical protein